MQEIKFIGKYVKDHWLQYLLGIAALFAVDLVNTYIPQFTGNITDGLTDGTLDMAGVMSLVWKILMMGGLIALGRMAFFPVRCCPIH